MSTIICGAVGFILLVTLLQGNFDRSEKKLKGILVEIKKVEKENKAISRELDLVKERVSFVTDDSNKLRYT